jgi:hypothetical protein
MDDLAQFLSDRLDDDEEVARDAAHLTPGHWTTEENYPVSVADELPAEADVFERAVAFDEGSPSEQQAAHIARHDPARVLAQVAIDREMLNEYDSLTRAYAAHRKEADRLKESADEDVIRRNALRREADYLPAILHILQRWAKRKAALYDNHRDYRQEWRP